MFEPLVSVIIPTHNRLGSLKRTLSSLASQSLSSGVLEVVVVDDGSTEDVHSVVNNEYPFYLKYVHQAHLGAAAARNNGAVASVGQVLIFADDDICPLSQTIQYLVDEVERSERTIVLGTLIIPPEIYKESIFAWVSSQGKHAPIGEVPFTASITCLLAIRRDEFFGLGAFQDPTGGWPNWDDLDFGYRAHLNGFRFVGLPDAVAEHWDHAALDLDIACRRWQRASEAAARLFLHYPQLRQDIPMFQDKGPIHWGKDSTKLIGRKLARNLASTRCLLGWMIFITRFLEKRYPHPFVLSRFYRWIIGGYIFNGYRRGLKELKLHD